MSYPEGWDERAATGPWRGGIDNFGATTSDFLYDPTLTDHLFLTITSRPIGDTTPDEWVAEQLTLGECVATEPIAVDGATGLIGADDCNAAAVTTDGRGYRTGAHTDLRSREYNNMLCPLTTRATRCCGWIGGTAYRIRTGDLRLERAVSWASRRMRHCRCGVEAPSPADRIPVDPGRPQPPSVRGGGSRGTPGSPRRPAGSCAHP
jgi:hypothetical protein